MKIKTLSLTDFRAFPGPAPAVYEVFFGAAAAMALGIASATWVGGRMA